MGHFAFQYGFKKAEGCTPLDCKTALCRASFKDAATYMG